MRFGMFTIVSAAASLAVAPAGLRAGEGWAGLAGSGPRHNASVVGIAPHRLRVLWRRQFATVPLGDQTGPNNEMSFAAGKGSRNLTLLDGRLALIAADADDAPDATNDYYCTVLDAADGRTLNCVRIKSSAGGTRAYRWPHACVSASTDNVCGIVQIAWDPQTRILFTGQGAYSSSYTAYRPLADLATHRPGRWQEGEPAYRELTEKHPGFQDAFGRTRGQQMTVFGPADRLKPMRPYTWGLSGFYVAPDRAGDAKPPKYDTDWETVFSRQGSSYYNTSSWFPLDTAGPLMVNCKGADWGHNAAGDAYVFNKHTGTKAITAMPELPGGGRLRCFTAGGAMVANGRLFCAGPAEGRLGVDRPEGRMPKLDQGLWLWAYDVALADRRPNDTYSGAGAAETATLTPAFAWKLDSRFAPDPNDLTTYGQSYYECDGFYRPKAMLADGKALWFAWKPSRADAVELIRADDKAAKAFPLNVGRGLMGADLWPKMSLADIDGRKHIVYFTGYAKHRRRLMPTDVVAELKRIHGADFSRLPQKEVDLTVRQAKQAGIWDGELLPPRGPAELAVFDATSGKLKWTYNVSVAHPWIPANGFWTHLDKTAMVVAGTWAYIGWVDVTGQQAALRLVALDITADRPKPIVSAVPLGFPSAGDRQTALFDLIAADGRLYALVTQSDRLWIRDPRWEAQHVIAIGLARE